MQCNSLLFYRAGPVNAAPTTAGRISTSSHAAPNVSPVRPPIFLRTYAENRSVPAIAAAPIPNPAVPAVAQPATASSPTDQIT